MKKRNVDVSRYDSTLIGTHPSAYQLLPRSRHGVLVDEEAKLPLAADIYDPDWWVKRPPGITNFVDRRTVLV